MTPLPEDFDEFQTFKLDKETYSQCSVITGFIKGNVQTHDTCSHGSPCSGLFSDLVSELQDSDSADANRVGAELDKLSKDLYKFFNSTTSEESYDEFRDRGVGFSSLFGIIGGGSELFGFWEPIQLTADEQAVGGSMPFLNVSTDNFLNDGAGAIYIYGPNEFDWYWDCS